MVKLKNKKTFNLIGEYKKSFEFIKSSKKFIYIIIGIFLSFVCFGFFFPVPEQIYQQIVEFLKELVEKTSNMSHLELITFIISNNLQSTFLGIAFGFFFGIFPIISAVANGYLLGFVAAVSVESAGILSLWKIFPHGIFELPAIMISLGLGLKLGASIFERDKKKAFKLNILNSLRVFLLIIVPLLITAGIIEGTLMVFNP